MIDVSKFKYVTEDFNSKSWIISTHEKYEDGQTIRIAFATAETEQLAYQVFHLITTYSNIAYNVGKEHGREDMQKDLRETLGIK